MRIGLFLVVVLAGFLTPWWVCLSIAALYALRYTAYELIALGVLFDVSFGLRTFALPFPVAYTLLFLALLVVAAYSKPFMTFSSDRA